MKIQKNNLNLELVIDEEDKRNLLISLVRNAGKIRSYFSLAVNSSVNEETVLSEEFPDCKIEYVEEEAKRVQRMFGGLIHDTVSRIVEKHSLLPPHVIVVSCENDNGMFAEPNFIGIPSGAFSMQGTNTLERGKAFLVHELGHYKIKELYGDPWSPPKEFVRLYDAVVNSEKPLFIFTFKDGIFVNDKGGHPYSSPDELYASAFMIAEMGFIPRYKELFFPTLNKEQKKLAEKIFEFVQRKEVAR